MKIYKITEAKELFKEELLNTNCDYDLSGSFGVFDNIRPGYLCNSKFVKEEYKDGDYDNYQYWWCFEGEEFFSLKKATKIWILDLS